MNGMYLANDIAKYVINYSNNNGYQITNLRLQKLLYFIQGNYAKKYDRRLIDEDFYAWQLGPVIPEVYFDYYIYSSIGLPSQSIEKELDENIVAFIETITKEYSEYSTRQLVEISHKQDPWKYNYEIFGDKAIIPFDSINSYFRERNE